MNTKYTFPLLLALSGLLATSATYATPLNSTPDGNSWKCNAGFKKQGQQCNRIFVPPNAGLSGAGWICNTGYKLQGSQCNATGGVSAALNQTIDFEPVSQSQTYNEDLELAENHYAEGEYSEALPFFQRLADERSGRAQLYLGFMHDLGQGVLTNKRLAANHYLKAARHGHTEAQRNIANLYSNGEGIPQNHTQAAYWFEKAAQQGDVQSQYHLGRYFDNGTAGIKNYKKAVYWYKQSAEQGNFSAQYLVGLYSCIGKGVSKDLRQCALWTQKAHENGHAEASQVWDKYRLWKHL